MIETKLPITGNKEDIYRSLIPQIKSFIGKETNRMASLANITAILQSALDFFWTGFYIAEDNNLILGPFQGEPACSRIGYGKGVCGTAWAHKKTIVVNDVNKFDGHIACSSLSKSEIVIPLSKNGKVIAVLDIDSEHPAYFDDIDARYLKQIAELVVRYCF